MTLFKNTYRIESARLSGWNYCDAGWYFVTICTNERGNFFRKIAGGRMILSPVGEIVTEEWQRNQLLRADVALDLFVVMPNHIQGIVVINETPPGPAPETPHRGVSTRRPSLGSIIGQFKSASTKRIWAAGFSDFAWQPRFYDHIIRGVASLRAIRQYILDNPGKWALDKENPENPHA